MSQIESFVPYDGGALWSCASGPAAAPPILLCSGGPGCCDYLQPVADMLDDTYHVIRFEQRGCGRSTMDGAYNLSTAIEDMERVRRHYGIERWIVGGHSWGANLAFVYAMQYPERARALLYIAGNGIHNDRHWSEEYHRNREARGEVSPAMEYPFNPEVNEIGNRTLKELGRAPDFYARVAAMRVPALFLMAENDIRPSWPARQLANLMPNAKYITVEGASHYVWLDKAAGMRRALLGYLRAC